MTSPKGRMSLAISAARERGLKITLSLQPFIELPMVATKIALDSRLWIFFDAIFKRRSVLGVLASCLSRYLPRCHQRRPRYRLERAQLFWSLVIAATPRKRCPKAGFCFSDFATIITVQRSYSTNQPHFKPQFEHSCLG